MMEGVLTFFLFLPLGNYCFLKIFIVLLFIYAYNAWLISPPYSLPPPPPPQYPAETILPLPLILLKREYKQ
jgi:hypothetical protein